MKCKHELSEKETACADGMCPLCQYETIKQLIAENVRLRAEIELVSK